MASRRLQPEDWAPAQQTHIYTRPMREPRDERAISWRPSQRKKRPAPVIIVPTEHSAPQTPPETPTSSSPTCPPRDSVEHPGEYLASPEIVDLAMPSTWQRRGGPTHRKNSTGAISALSNRLSGISYEIPTYYFRGPTPGPIEQTATVAIATDAPRIDTPVIDPAMEKFDFGLAAALLPSSQRTSINPRPKIEPDALAGARVSFSPAPPITPPEHTKPKPPQPKVYSLFPSSKPLHDQSSCTPSPTATASDPPAPSRSYRPRKESLASATSIPLRARKDSCNSYRSSGPQQKQCHPALRVRSAGSGSNNTTTSSSSTASQPDYRSRWSDDTITSPTAATTLGSVPRTSFSMLLADVGRDSSQYPACFFEHDDEDEDGGGESAPLRMKFAWKRSISSQQHRPPLSMQQEQMAGGKEWRTRGGRRRGGLGRRVVRVLLCGGCGGI